MTTAAGGSFADQALAVAADAYEDAPSWELGTRAAIGRLFAFLAECPDRTNACVLADAEGGVAALQRRDQLIARFVELLKPGFEQATARPPDVVGEAIGGGIYELVRVHVLERRLDELPTATPDATIMALSPFIGTADAGGIGQRAN